MNRKLFKIASGLAVTGALALPAAAQAQGRLIWSGNVDSTATVSLHGRDIQTRTVNGKSVSNVGDQLFGRLPRRPVFVNLRHRGRGIVQIVQRPRPFNNYTTVVRIHDPQPGSGFYSFQLVW